MPSYSEACCDYSFKKCWQRLLFAPKNVGEVAALIYFALKVDK